MKGEEKKMPTKLLDKEETLSAADLRTISQKDLLEKVNSAEKLGLIANNSLSMAILSWEKYEDIIDLIETKDKKILEMGNFLEDIQLAQIYGNDILNTEKGNSKSYEVNTVDDLFSMLD